MTKKKILEQPKEVWDLFQTSVDMKYRVAIPKLVINMPKLKDEIIKSKKLLKKIGI